MVSRNNFFPELVHDRLTDPNFERPISKIIRQRRERLSKEKKALDNIRNTELR